MGAELEGKCRGAGGAAADAAQKWVDRATTALAGLLAPDDPENQRSVRQVVVLLGDLDREQRSAEDLPAVTIRPISDRRERQDGHLRRVLGLQAAILVRWWTGADVAYAWNIWDRLSRDLAEEPYLGAGQYVVNAESLDCREDQQLSELYGAYALSATVDVIMPAWDALRGPDGEPLDEENRAFGGTDD